MRYNSAAVFFVDFLTFLFFMVYFEPGDKILHLLKTVLFFFFCFLQEASRLVKKAYDRTEDVIKMNKDLLDKVKKFQNNYSAA